MTITEISQFLKEHQYPSLSPKAVFFDMDGVLFDSMKYHAKAWVQAMTDVGLPFTEHDAYMHEGCTGTHTINGVFVKVNGREATEDEKKSIYRLKSAYFDECGKAEPIPGIKDLLQRVKQAGLQIYVVTGSGQLSLLDNLDYHFPGYFSKDKMITAYDVKHGKPHPEPYLKALGKSGLNPWEVVVVENAPMGVQSGAAAGLFTVGVNTGPLDPKILTEYGAHIVYDNMDELNNQWNQIQSKY